MKEGRKWGRRANLEGRNVEIVLSWDVLKYSSFSKDGRKRGSGEQSLKVGQ